jgi:hypothetical protein
LRRAGRIAAGATTGTVVVEVVDMKNEFWATEKSPDRFPVQRQYGQVER